MTSGKAAPRPAAESGLSGPGDLPLLAPVYLGGPVPDTENCAREPIHIPGSVQPHGALLVLALPGLEVLQASANSAEVLGLGPNALLGRSLRELADAGSVASLARFLNEAPTVPEGTRVPQHVATLTLAAGAEAPSSGDTSAGRTLDMTAHLLRRGADAGGRALLELEPQDPAVSPEFYHTIKNALSSLEDAPDLPTLCDRAASEVRALTGFDRVMIYRFAADDSGEVVAEAKTDALHPYLNQRFPESDIPRQARALYVQNLLRLTADVDAPPAPLFPLLDPQSGQPVNLGSAVLRSTSPMHLQYLRNMGVASSLSVSIVQDGRLWGLISCHHGAPKVVAQATRSALEFLGRVLTLQVRAKQEADIHRFRAALQSQHLNVLNTVGTALDPLTALSSDEAGLLPLMSATGAAIFFGGELRLLGDAPDEAQARALLGWLRARGEALYVTESLSGEWPGGAAMTRNASGVLAISVGGAWDEAVLWFRPEVPQTIEWGGNPEKPVEEIGDGFRVSPRRSFETYVQTVQGRSEPWHPGEVQEARDLRGALTSALAERLAALRQFNAQLEAANRQLEAANREWRQYGFVLSHDLQEPLRLISNFLGMLSSRYGEQLDAGGQKVVGYTLAEAGRLRGLIRNLYDYTELSGLSGGAVKAPELVDLNDLMAQVRSQLQAREAEVGARLTVGALPTVEGYPERLERLLHALVDNALKFVPAGSPPRVTVSCEAVEGGYEIRVTDEGLGIAPEHLEKVFVLFQRLNRRESYPGNGIGLTMARKLAELHGGSLTVQSQPGQGSTFILRLPQPPATAKSPLTTPDRQV